MFLAYRRVLSMSRTLFQGLFYTQRHYSMNWVMEANNGAMETVTEGRSA